LGTVRKVLTQRLAKIGVLAAKKQAKKGLVPSIKLEYHISVDNCAVQICWTTQSGML